MRSPKGSSENQRPKPVVLCILDGWGYRANGPANAIAEAATPNYDNLLSTCPHALLETSGAAVGLPAGQMGNSEVGHMNIGAGRIVLQDLPRIDRSIEVGEFENLPALVGFAERVRASAGTCHVLGLVSPGGVHSHMTHIAASVKAIAGRGVPVVVHAFLDGRDTPPSSAAGYLDEFERAIADCPNARIGTIIGRYWAMDRDRRWDRTECAYNAIVFGKGEPAKSAEAAIATAYAAGETDEFVQPLVINGYAGMSDGDGLFMANFRADRVRQILAALLSPEFDEFDRGDPPQFAAALGMVSYSDELDPYLPALFPSVPVEHSLGEVVADADMHQLRLAETEKYAHVTFFLNGGREKCFAGEERILIPSPKVATYDLKPEMSAREVTARLTEAITGGNYDLIVVNYANPDMVGHTGKLAAAITAVEVIDECLGKICEALKATGGAMLLTADHGNVEEMVDSKGGGAHTAHTERSVPVILVRGAFLSGASEGNVSEHMRNGCLADVAPTLLDLMELEPPSVMTGKSLLIAGDLQEDRSDAFEIA